MASFDIHEQENLAPAMRQKQLHVLPHGQKKRSVLGAIENQPERILKGKSLGLANGENRDENVFPKKNTVKPAPVVPVAQFEAFKVYEDTAEERIDQKLREMQRRRKDKDPFANIYKGTEDRLITKKEAQDILAKEARQVNVPVVASNPPEIEAVFGSPMSIEKINDENDSRNAIAKSKSYKDLFFELADYRNEIVSYLREHEKQNRPKPGYMRKQPDITHNMRSILVDWLVEVAEEYKLHTETLYLAVNCIDRFLSYMSVVRAKLQLVGTAAMFIAAKYEEINPPGVSEFVYITDDTYNKRQVTRMEILILRILDFDLSVPTPYTFITAISICNKLSEKVMFLAMYISELSLLEAEPTLGLLPSAIACASLAIAQHNLDEEPWNSNLTESTGYTLKELEKTIEFLNLLFKKAPTFAQQAIQEKYKSGKYLHVATLTPKDDEIKFE
ncbi:Cyclin, C-terminal domain [Popillia japonica]|uniref:Cyclin, C-terminal domain n=1 Tax=Popillia japonica TaxID=7064 RepID=A0AAW1IU22_POPJA